MIPITLLISLYNAERDWPACWESLKAQTFMQWECVAVDDGSTDNTSALLATSAASDSRLRVLTNERNIGLTASLNRGIKEARGTYIARLDADDRARPTRFENQHDYLEQNPSVGVLGSAYEECRPDGKRVVTPPLTHTGIVWQMGFHNALMHPAVMVRRDLLLSVEGYDETLTYAQDYDLWERLMMHTRIVNLASVLLDYAVHPNQISQTKQAEQQRIADTISQRRLQAILGEPLPLETVQMLRLWYTQLPPSTSAETLQTMGLYFRLLDRLAEDSTLDAEELKRIRRYWYARIARLTPTWQDIRAAGWTQRDQWGVGLRLLRQWMTRG